MSLTRPFPVDTAPVPVAYEWDGGLNGLGITFNKPLVNQSHAPANWTLTHSVAPDSTPVTVTFASPTDLLVQFVGHAGDGAVNIVYAASPEDVVGTNGLPVTAFVFPVSS